MIAKNKFNTIIGLILTIAILSSFMPTVAFATTAERIENGTCGDSLEWSFSSDGTLTISGDGAMQSYNDVDAFPWYGLKDEITALVIEDGVTTISASAFKGYEGLSEINIPASITSIGKWAFNFCPNITKIKVSKINANYHSYENCLIDTVNKVLVVGCANSIIPTDGSVTVIGDAAFASSSELTTIAIPDTITEISSNAFWSCSSLSEITIPSSVIEIGGRAFYACTSLTEITVPKSVIKCGSSVTVLDGAFINCTGLENVTILCGSVGNDAFSGCTGIKNLYLGSSVETISSSAFMDCVNLETISVDEGNNELYVSGNCLVKKSYYPATEYMYWSAIIVGCNNSTLPSSVHYVAPYAFYGRTGFSDTAGLSNLWYIDVGAFYNCSGLTGTANLLYTHLEGIEEKAFYGCTGLTGLVLSDEPGEEAFYNCPNIKSIHFTSNFTGGALGKVIDLTSVETITVSQDNQYYFSSGNCLLRHYSNGFSPNKYMLSLGCKNSVLPTEGVWYIAAYAFNGCSELTNITIPVSVTDIGLSAFSGCENLSDIYYTGTANQWDAISGRDVEELNAATVHYNSPATPYSGSCGENVSWTLSYNCVLTISGTGAMTDYSTYSIVPWYEHRNGIESIVVENGVTNIGDYAFYGCSKIERIAFPNSVARIGDVSLYGCGISEIDIPSSVTNIGEAAFYNCSELNDVFFSGSESQWNNIEIGDDNSPLNNAAKHYGTEDGQVEYITMNQTELSLVVGDTDVLTVDVFPDDATDKSIEWSSSDEDIATVSQSGTVTAIAPGTATITASTLDGGNRTAYCEVTVFKCGDENFKPHNWNEGEITTPATCTEYGSKKHTCLKCGVIKNVSISPLGHTLSNGKCTQCTEVKSVSLNNTVLHLQTGDTSTLVATVSPSNATNKTVFWTSSDNTVATVQDGKVIAKEEGKATISVRTKDGGYQATCVVYVSETNESSGVVWDGTVAEGFASGSGGPSDPYIIETADQLAFLASSVNSGTSYSNMHISLANDLFLNTTANPTYGWTPIGNSSSTAFEGTFDGNGHTINGLSNKNSSVNFGLFGYIGTEGTVVNLGLTNVNINYAQSAGGIAYRNSGTIWKSYVTGTVSATYGGGIAYYNYGVITQCYNNAYVSGSYAGGIAGYNSSSVYVCYNTGTIAGGCGGGIVGYNNYWDARVANCYNTGKVSGGTAGGIVGENNDTVTSCYNIGKIAGTSSYHGGVVGRNNGTITGCCYLDGCIASGNSLGSVVSDTQLKSSYVLEVYFDFNFSSWELGTVCGYEYPTLRNLPMQSNTHSYDSWEELDANSHKGQCDCGSEVTEDHTWYDSEITVEATHTTAGSITYICTKCSARKTEVLPAITDHVFKDWTEVDESTHVGTCECGETETKEHSFDSWTNAGDNHQSECECGFVKSEDHSWNNGEITTEPTHMEIGVKTFSCTKCPATKTEDVPKTTTHSFGDWTSVNEETHKRTCECGEDETENHSWNTGTTTKYPSAGTPGTKKYTCTKCKETKTEDVIELYAGSCGSYAKYSYDVYGVLTIKGTGSTYSYSSSPWSGLDVKKVVVENGITAIGSCLFSDLRTLTEVVLPERIQYIDRQAFMNCINLTTINLPDSITTIGLEAFYHTGLKSIKIPAGVTSLTQNIFADSALEEVLVHGNVTKIDYGAFGSAKKVYYDGSSTDWKEVNGYYIYSDEVIYLHQLVKEPSCTETGNRVEYWLGYDGTGYYTDSTRTTEMQSSPIIAALGHSEVVDPAVAATCSSTGLTEGKHCSRCTEVIVAQESTSKLPHTYGEWTKVDDKNHARTCKCTDTQTEAHSYGDWIKVDADTHKHTCKCGHFEIKNHTWDGGETTTPPTQTSVGEMTYTCTGCSATKTEEIPMISGSISGSVKSFGDETANITIELADESGVLDTETVVGNNQTYSFDGLASGTYTVRVSKSKHCTREYEVVVSDSDVMLDLEIWLYGDVNTDGTVNHIDVLQINRNIASQTSVFDAGTDELKAYRFNVANVTAINSSDSILNHVDVLQINRKIANLTSIFDNLQ